MDEIRVILAEDHALMREGTRGLLERFPEIEIVGEAEDGQRAMELIDELKPDVAILDIRMPKLNGIEVVRKMKHCCSKTKALMLTAYDDDVYILNLMKAGALGYLLKTAGAKELAEAVRTVAAGEPVLHPVIAMKIARLWIQRGMTLKAGTGEQLSPRELEILELAAKGFRNKAIGEKLGVSIRTVEGHFKSIFDKLGAATRMEAVLSALSQHLITLNDEARDNSLSRLAS